MSIKQTKKCSKCGEEKSLSEFHKSKNTKNGYRSECKLCRINYNQTHKKKLHEYYKAYYQKNKKAINLKGKIYYQKFKEEIREDYKDYYKNHKKEILKQKKKYCQEHKKEINEYKRKNYLKHLKQDDDYRLLKTLRCRTTKAIKKQYGEKAFKTIELLGCTVKECRQYLESLFQIGMKWSNHGDWHIDHIRPCSSFDLTDPKQQKECFNYKNLQPLWAEDNLNKSNKWKEDN